MPSVTHTRDEAKVILLQSLLGGRKMLHMGRSPVDAIEIAMEMVHEGLIKIDFSNWVTITEEGHVFLQKRKAVPPAERSLIYKTARYRGGADHEKSASQDNHEDQ